MLILDLLNLACKSIQQWLLIKFGFRNGLFIVSVLLNVCSEIENMDYSCELFDIVQPLMLLLWNSMISTYIEYGYYREAVSFFVRMTNEGIRGNGRTIIIMLTLCAELDGCLKDCKSLHALLSQADCLHSIPLQN